jgi:hypothetical protein
MHFIPEPKSTFALITKRPHRTHAIIKLNLKNQKQISQTTCMQLAFVVFQPSPTLQNTHVYSEESDQGPPQIEWN